MFLSKLWLNITTRHVFWGGVWLMWFLVKVGDVSASFLQLPKTPVLGRLALSELDRP